MICTACVQSVVYDPIRVGIIFVSGILAIIFLYLMGKAKTPEKQVLLLYLGFAAAFFPFGFLMVYGSCMQVYSACDSLRVISFLILITGLFAFVASSIFAPAVFAYKTRRKSQLLDHHHIKAYVSQHALKIGVVAPEIYILNKASPVAFSLRLMKSYIFFSVGLADLLSKRELEAVLLHELGHIKHKSSWLFLLLRPARLLSFGLNSVKDARDIEEDRADKFVLRVQNSSRHVLSARKKLRQYYEYDD